MLTIKVLGSGCAQIIDEMSLEAEIIKVTEYQDIMKYNIMSTPGLVINEKLVSAEPIPSPAEITTFLTSALEAA